MLLDERGVGIREVTVILNSGAGGGADVELQDRVRKGFESAGWTVHVAVSGKSARPEVLAREAVERGVQIVVAAGGDGTVSAVASAVAGTESTLGVLPIGTLNHFAKDIHLPLDLAQAIAVIDRGKTARVDVGEVNGKVFVNNSSLGLYPSMVFERDLQRRTGRSKWIAMFWAGISVLRRFRTVRVRLSVNGETSLRKTPFVFVGNNEYRVEGFQMGTRARLDAGQLSVYIAQPASRSRVVWLTLLALCGRLLTAKDFEVLCLSETSIETRHKRLRISLDGEVTVLSTPLQYRVRPAALRVFVP